MQTLTGAKLFAPAKRKRRAKDWFERAKLVVAAARDRAIETAQQRAVPSMKRFPTVLRRFKFSVSKRCPGRGGVSGAFQLDIPASA